MLCTLVPNLSWSSYKVDHKRDKIGVFVSTVSTKIPFKVRKTLMKVFVASTASTCSSCFGPRSYEVEEIILALLAVISICIGVCVMAASLHEYKPVGGACTAKSNTYSRAHTVQEAFESTFSITK